MPYFILLLLSFLVLPIPSAHTEECPSAALTYLIRDLFEHRPAPLISQACDYTCGAAALQSWLKTQGVDLSEAELARIIRATKKDGSAAKDLVRGVRRELKFKARYETDLSLEKLALELKFGRGVIVNFQSEGVGHWSLLVDISDETVTLMDPWFARTNKNQYNKIPTQDFLKDWYGMNDGPRGAVFIERKK